MAKKRRRGEKHAEASKPQASAEEKQIVAQSSGDSPRAESSQPEEIRHADGRIEHPSVRREPRDVRFRWVMAVIVVAIAIGAANFTLVWRFFVEREQHVEKTNASDYPLADNPATALPQSPRLEQIDRLSGIESASAYQDQRAKLRFLNSYGSTPDEGYIHIPIGQAMRLVVDRLPASENLPTRNSKDDGLVDSGESNSGRMFRGQSR